MERKIKVSFETEDNWNIVGFRNFIKMLLSPSLILLSISFNIIKVNYSIVKQSFI